MKDNEPLSSLTHFIGFLLSIAGLVLLIVFASLYKTSWHVVGFSIFGASLILLYLASTLYHFFPLDSKAKKIFKKIDHSFIYILIAGTYTPICFTVLRGGWGWSIFGAIWGLAVFGVLLKSSNIKINEKLSTIIYLFMGWIILIAFFPLLNSVTFKGFLFLFAGGIAYTVGAIFFCIREICSKNKVVWNARSFPYLCFNWKFFTFLVYVKIFGLILSLELLNYVINLRIVTDRKVYK